MAACLIPTYPQEGDLWKWLSPKAFGVALGALILLVFPAVVLGTGTFYFRDCGLFGYPLAAYHRESFWRAEIPLWNPLNDCGIPFLAQWNTLVCYPLSVIYLFLPLPWSLGLYSLFHFWLSGVGMYFLAFRWTGNRLAASVAGVTFAFNGLTLNCLMWPNNIAALGWMPWVINSVEAALGAGWRRIVVAAVLGAMQMLTGGPEVVVSTWGILLALWLIRLWKEKPLSMNMLTRPLLIVLFIAAASAVQLLPFLDLLRHSQRDTAYASSESAMPVWGWANLLVPVFHCYRTSAGVYLQPGQSWTSSYYAGIGTLALASLAVMRVNHWRVRLLACLAAFALVLALGDAGPLYPALRGVLPFIGVMNFPIKFVIPVALILPLLAATAIGDVSSPAKDGRETPVSRQLAGIGLSILALTGVILWLSYLHPTEEGEWPAVWRNAIVRLLVAAMVLYVVLAISKRPAYRRRELLGAGLLLLLWLDARTHVPSQNPTVSPEAYLIDLRQARKMAPVPKAGETRAMVSLVAIQKFNLTVLADPVAACLGTRIGLSHNCNLLESIPKVDGFYSLYLPEEREVRRRLYLTTDSILERVADYLGVSQITAKGTFFVWAPRTTFLPLITAGQKPIFADDAGTLAALMSSDFDPQHVLYLSLESKPFAAVAAQVRAVAYNEEFASHKVRFSVNAQSSAVVSVAQSYYHWWHAYVDGRPVLLLRANHAFQAVVVPAGTHEVKLVYNDLSFLVGTVISVITLAALAAASLAIRPL